MMAFGAIATNAAAAGTANPYAYNLKVTGVEQNSSGENEATGETVTFCYTLNAPAVKITLNVYNGTETLFSQEYTDATLLTAGDHTLEVAVADMGDGGVDASWSIVATGETLTAPVETSTTYTFWSPYGIAVDNNPESAHFGRILVTESQMNMSTSYWTNSEGVLAGIYEFDPQMQRVQNASGTYGYNGGLPFAHYKYPSNSSVYTAKKVRISDDGRIFVGVLDCLRNPIYEVNPDNLNEWTPIFQGTMAADTSGVVTDADGNVVAIASASMDVVGSGENLKIVNLSCKGGQVYNYSYFSTDIYNLGTATSWSTAPSENVAGLSKQYTISSSGANVAFDKDGKGIWYVQYRGTPTEAQPAIKHVYKADDGTWTEDYSDITTVARGGGVGFNKDYTLLAIPTAAFNFAIYDMSEVEKAMQAHRVQAPTTLSPKYTMTTTVVRGFNDFAFDYADNLYTCDNGKEKFYCIALPRDNVNCEVPAPSGQSFKLPMLDTGVSEATVAKTVASTTYVNLNGATSETPFDGVNVVITHYTDGTKKVTKVIK